MISNDTEAIVIKLKNFQQNASTYLFKMSNYIIKNKVLDINLTDQLGLDIKQHHMFQQLSVN